jgi:hypothetical protein
MVVNACNVKNNISNISEKSNGQKIFLNFVGDSRLIEAALYDIITFSLNDGT